MQRYRFERLWIAAVASNLGDGLVLAAFPLLAASLTQDPVAISALTIAAGVPWLLFGLVSGAIVDRFDRRKLMVTFDTGRGLVLTLFAGVVIAGWASLWTLYVVAFLIAVGETVVDTGYQSILPALVPKEQLDTANGRLFATINVTHQFVGPPLGGYLFGLALVAPFAADAGTFAVAALMVFSIRGNFKPRDDGSDRVQLTIRASIVEGFRWLWANKPIRAFAVGAAMLNIGMVSGNAILVLYAKDQLGLGDLGFGGLFAATAAGYTVSATIAPAVTKRISRYRLIMASVTSISVSLMVIGLAPHWIVTATGLFLTGVATGMWDVIAVSFRQAAVPDRLLGRVMAAYRVLAQGAIAVGALLGGISAQFAGNGMAFVAGSLVALVGVIYVGVFLKGVVLDPAQVAAT